SAAPTVTHPTTTEISTLSLHDALPICSREPEPASVTPTEPPGRRRSIQVAAPDPETCSAPARTTASPRTITSTPPSPSSMKANRSEEHTSELQSRENLVCRLLLEKKKA